MNEKPNLQKREVPIDELIRRLVEKKKLDERKLGKILKSPARNESPKSK